MGRMTKRISLGLGVATLAVALAGVALMTGEHLQAQGCPGGRGGAGRFGPGGPGGPDGPGRGRGGPGGPGGPGMLNPMMLDRLGLSEQQHQQVKAIMDAQREAQEALGARGRQAHNALETAIAGETFNEGAIRALAADVATVESDMAVARAQVFAQVVQILTPDQRTKLKEMQVRMQERETRMQENRGQRREQRH
jgi:Spy/CpxP family protein refolding chaperone